MHQLIPASPTPASHGRSARTAGLAGAAALVLSLVACSGGGGSSDAPSAPPPAPTTTAYQLTTLVSDQPAGAGVTVDSNLVNPWGLAYGPTTAFWVANQGTDTTTVYDGLGHLLPNPIIVANPSVPGHTLRGPTGVVFNGSTGFNGDRFLLASLDGCICGWSSTATTTRRVDNSAAQAAYTGLALGGSGSSTYLFATNFTAGSIDVFDASYAKVDLGPTALVDPALPAGYSPFNAQVLGGKLFVTYAKRLGAATRETPGPGFGYVSVFNLDGSFVRRVASEGALNAPWGVAIAPASFGTYAGAVLVGNFGDGRITAFDAATGAQLGQLAGTDGSPLAVPGLWGMAFGNDGSAGSSSKLYVTAGPGGETHGLFGSIGVAGSGNGGGGGGSNGGGY